MLSVSDCIPNNVLQEYFEDASGLLIDQARDTLDTSTTSQSPDCWLCDSLDVVPEHLPVSFGASLSCIKTRVCQNNTHCVHHINYHWKTEQNESSCRAAHLPTVTPDCSFLHAWQEKMDWTVCFEVFSKQEIVCLSTNRGIPQQTAWRVDRQLTKVLTVNVSKELYVRVYWYVLDSQRRCEHRYERQNLSMKTQHIIQTYIRYISWLVWHKLCHRCRQRRRRRSQESTHQVLCLPCRVQTCCWSFLEVLRTSESEGCEECEDFEGCVVFRSFESGRHIGGSGNL